MLRKDCNHFSVFVERVFFEDPIPLKAEFDVPEGSKGVGSCVFRVVIDPIVFWETPKFNKGSDKLYLVTLSADMSETDDEIVLEEGLYHNAAVDSG